RARRAPARYRITEISATAHRAAAPRTRSFPTTSAARPASSRTQHHSVRAALISSRDRSRGLATTIRGIRPQSLRRGPSSLTVVAAWLALIEALYPFQNGRFNGRRPLLPFVYSSTTQLALRWFIV